MKACKEMVALNLRHPALLDVAVLGGMRHGGSQEWYRTRWQRLSGCGPTNASNLVWYLARSRPELAGLWETGAGKKADFLALMEEMFGHVTPGQRGVDSTGMFMAGVQSFASSRGMALEARSLDIPQNAAERPAPAEVEAFLLEALEADLPVAFLNLHHGAERRLDSWHWTTVAGLAPGLRATIYDQGKSFPVDLELWLRTTTMGGGFVVLSGGEEGI